MKFSSLSVFVLVLLLLVSSSGVYAADEHSGDENIDFLIERVCDGAFNRFTGPCIFYTYFFGSTQRMDLEGLNAGLAQANTQQDLNSQVLEADLELARDRVSITWLNISSLMLLVIEFIKIIFYLVLLLFLFHTPLLYLKLLNLFKDNITKRIIRRRSR